MRGFVALMLSCLALFCGCDGDDIGLQLRGTWEVEWGCESESCPDEIVFRTTKLQVFSSQIALGTADQGSGIVINAIERDEDVTLNGEVIGETSCIATTEARALSDGSTIEKFQMCVLIGSGVDRQILLGEVPVQTTAGATAVARLVASDRTPDPIF